MTRTYILLRTKTDPQTFLLVLIVILVITVAGYYFSRKAVVLRALRASGIKKIKNFSDGDTGKIIGKVVFAGDTIYAPLSKRKCVYYHVIVEEYRNYGRNASWHKIIEEERMGDIVLADGSGYAIIDANKAISYLIPDANYSSSSADAMEPELKEILARHGVDSRGFFGFSKSFRCSEGILEKGETFAVAGEGQWNETKDHNLNIPSSKVLVIIPGEKKELYISDDPEATSEQQTE